uniref:Putative secreted protein n=1 Tax=Amblyomma cajennense TaxID=34607 RepID=A0A023FBE3_AMBCJ
MAHPFVALISAIAFMRSNLMVAAGKSGSTETWLITFTLPESAAIHRHVILSSLCNVYTPKFATPVYFVFSFTLFFAVSTLAGTSASAV